MRDLTLGDALQTAIIERLRITEGLLSAALTKLDGVHRSAEVIAMPDLGLPQNVTRILGGFFTGALYIWDSDTPFIPVDSTLNACGVSLFGLDRTFDSA